MFTSDGYVFVSISQERWDKAKVIMARLHEPVTISDEVPFKPLEAVLSGFLIYLVHTYPAVNPGIHLTLDSWRPWRKDDGWRMTLAEI